MQRNQGTPDHHLAGGSGLCFSPFVSGSASATACQSSCTISHTTQGPRGRLAIIQTPINFVQLNCLRGTLQGHVIHTISECDITVIPMRSSSRGQPSDDPNPCKISYKPLITFCSSQHSLALPCGPPLLPYSQSTVSLHWVWLLRLQRITTLITPTTPSHTHRPGRSGELFLSPPKMSPLFWVMQLSL